ncbi:MAG: cupin domain-containing protein [Eubacteriales bacterium]
MKRSLNSEFSPIPRDAGPSPYVFNAAGYAVMNNRFRVALWTGGLLQLTMMSVPSGGKIPLEIHPHIDQMLYAVRGEGSVRTGMSSSALSETGHLAPGYAAMIPAGTWHEIINTGRGALKVLSVYAPPQHPRGTVHNTVADEDH